jgi:hypothetical protein
MIRLVNGVVEPIKNANLSVPIATIVAANSRADFIILIHHSVIHRRR